MISLVFRDFELDRRPVPKSPSGRAWFVLDGVCFPGEDWFDFPLSILGSAFDAHKALCQGESEAASYFFDGSFHLTYRRSDLDSELPIKIGAYSEGEDGEGFILETDAEVSLPQFREALMEAAKLMAAALSSAEEADGENSRIVARILSGLSQNSTCNVKE